MAEVVVDRRRRSFRQGKAAHRPRARKTMVWPEVAMGIRLDGEG
jgi:hypothetical protein